MTDHVTNAIRSRIMGSVRTKNTGPEKAIRAILTKSGYRYRLHRKDLPGTPDIVFPGKRKVIFVNGCFWHGHLGCSKATLPQTRTDYWLPKIAKNRENDKRNQEVLEGMGWHVLTVWQCELRTPIELQSKLASFLDARVVALQPGPD